MSAAKHTPGPWKVNPLSQHDIVTANGTHVCSTMFSHEIAGTDEANGFLIASAPDLLAALTELERQADFSLDYRPEFRTAIANAHAAIARATGETA